LIGLASLGLTWAWAGAMALALDPSFLFSVNGAGIPRWLPHGASALLAVAAIATWRPRIDCGVLASWWAIAAGCFASPALHAAGWPTLPAAWMVPAGFALLALAVAPSTGRRPRMAVLAALSTPFAVVVALAAAPNTEAARALDAGAYTLILAAAAVSARLGLSLRRPS
jgi:hypothetical protein